MNQTLHSIQKTLTDTLNLTDYGHEIFYGQWVVLSVGEWMAHLKKKAQNDEATASSNRLRFELLDFIIQKIKHNRYGASCDYELFEQRRQEEIGYFLSDFTLTDEESAYFKERVGFIEDFSPYATFCSDCDGEVSAFASAKSLQMEGVELCSHCLNSRYC